MRMRHGRPSAVPSPASRSGNRRRERRNGRPHAHRREARAAESRRGARMRTGARRGRPRADGGCVCRRAQGEGIRTTGTGPEARALPVRRARAAERTQTAELRRHTTSHQLQSSPRDTRARCSTGGGAWLPRGSHESSSNEADVIPISKAKSDEYKAHGAAPKRDEPSDTRSRRWSGSQSASVALLVGLTPW